MNSVSKDCVMFHFIHSNWEIVVFSFGKFVSTVHDKLGIYSESQQVLGWLMWGSALWCHDGYQVPQIQVQPCSCCKKSSPMWGCFWLIEFLAVLMISFTRLYCSLYSITCRVLPIVVFQFIRVPQQAIFMVFFYIVKKIFFLVSVTFFWWWHYHWKFLFFQYVLWLISYEYSRAGRIVFAPILWCSYVLRKTKTFSKGRQGRLCSLVAVVLIFG